MRISCGGGTYVRSIGRDLGHTFSKVLYIVTFNIENALGQ
jgi:hypothetical protein